MVHVLFVLVVGAPAEIIANLDAVIAALSPPLFPPFPPHSRRMTHPLSISTLAPRSTSMTMASAAVVS